MGGADKITSLGKCHPPFLNNKRKTKMKKNYYAPKSNVIKFEMCDAMMYLPQSEPGNGQFSDSKDDWEDNVKWDSTEDEACELDS